MGNLEVGCIDFRKAIKFFAQSDNFWFCTLLGGCCEENQELNGHQFYVSGGMGYVFLNYHNKRGVSTREQKRESGINSLLDKFSCHQLLANYEF